MGRRKETQQAFVFTTAMDKRHDPSVVINWLVALGTYVGAAPAVMWYLQNPVHRCLVAWLAVVTYFKHLSDTRSGMPGAWPWTDYARLLHTTYLFVWSVAVCTTVLDCLWLLGTDHAPPMWLMLSFVLATVALHISEMDGVDVRLYAVMRTTWQVHAFGLLAVVLEQVRLAEEQQQQITHLPC